MKLGVGEGMGESAGWHSVHVRVNDAATGQPTPVRLRLSDAAGNTFAPFGRSTEFATGRNQDVGGNLLLDGKSYAYIDGQCEVRLPAGLLNVEIDKGPEYVPLRSEVRLSAGKIALRFAVERWADLRGDGWHSGDTRTHHLTPHGALLEAAAEDLAVVELLATDSQVIDVLQQSHPAISNILAFSGQRPALEKAGHLVTVNTHNVHPILGSLALLNSHRAVYPLSSGGDDYLDNWTLDDWCDQCHRKGGLVVWTHVPQERSEFGPGERLADLINGKIDAFEISLQSRKLNVLLAEWYDLLNVGLRIPIVGSSGKDSNRIALGSMRTYARLKEKEPLTYPAWIEALRAEQTFVTNGPLLELAIEGRGPGDHLELSEGSSTVRVIARARSQRPFQRLELIANGSVVARADATGSPAHAELDIDFPMTQSGWIAARCWDDDSAKGNDFAFAHTSPVYVTCEKRERAAKPDAVARLTGQLDTMLTWAQQEARCETERRRENLVAIFQKARDWLRNGSGPGP